MRKVPEKKFVEKIKTQHLCAVTTFPKMAPFIK
jgi:hypothetical protein